MKNFIENELFKSKFFKIGDTVKLIMGGKQIDNNVYTVLDIDKENSVKLNINDTDIWIDSIYLGAAEKKN